MSENKKIRFTFIDAIIVLIIVAVIAFVGYNFFGKEVVNNNNTEDTFIVSYYIEEAPDYAAQNVSKGDAVSDEAKKIPLGTVVDVELKEAAVYSPDSNGNTIKSSKDGYKSVMITTEVNANEFAHGIKVSGTEYVVGHSLTIYAGKAKLYGKVSGIQKK